MILCRSHLLILVFAVESPLYLGFELLAFFCYVHLLVVFHIFLGDEGADVVGFSVVGCDYLFEMGDELLFVELGVDLVSRRLVFSVHG